MTEAPSRRQPIRAAFFFFSLVLFVYLLSYRGTLGSDDEQLFAAVSQNLAFRGELTAGQLLGNTRLAGVYNGSGLAQVALGAIAVRLLDPTGVGFVQGLLVLPAVAGALAGAALLLFLLETGRSRDAAVITAVLFAFGTPAWVFGQTFFRETVAALFVAASLLYGRRAFADDRDRGRTGNVSLGLFLFSLAGMVLTKEVLVFVIPAIVYAVWPGQLDGRAALRAFARPLAWVLLAVAAAFAAGALAIPAGVPTRFDLFRAVPQAVELIARRAGEPFLVNLLAPLVSPGRGLLWFAPLAFAGLFAWIRPGPGGRRVALAAAWSVGVLVLVEALAIGNEGWSLAWGPRRLVPVLPLLVAAAAPWIERALGSGRWWARRSLAAGVGVSGLIQLGGVLISRAQVRTALEAAIGDFYSDGLVWSLRYSPVVYGWRLLVEGVQPDLAALRLMEAGDGWLPFVYPLVAAFGFCFASAGLAWALARPVPWARDGMAVPVGVLLAVSAVSLLWAGRSDPYYFGAGRYAEAARFLEARAGPEDAVVVDHYLSGFWHYLLNHNGERWVAWHSLPVPWETFGARRLADFEAAIDRLGEREAIWIVSEHPDFLLSENFGLLQEIGDGYLDSYLLRSVEGFSVGPGAPSVLVFEFRR